VRIPRFQLVEVEDEPWLPPLLRRAMTDFLAEVTARTDPYRSAAPIVAGLIAEAPNREVVDLCSGAGGPWPGLLESLPPDRRPAMLTLSDAYPNVAALARFPAGTRVRYREKPTPAHETPADSGAAQTIFSAFHHFPPRAARRLLAATTRTGAPIAVFEATERSLRALGLMLTVPFLVWALTPLIRPRRWWRWVLTYPIPIVPLLVMWDGLVSCLRSYRPEELRELAGSKELAHMRWEVGQVHRPGTPLPVTYLIGRPLVRTARVGEVPRDRAVAERG